jgi:acyl-CoA dehydrogenase
MPAGSRARDLTQHGAALVAVADRVGSEHAAPAADKVDRDACFPREAMDALRAEGLLGALVPARYGGADCSYADVAAMCRTLGRYCSSAAMVFAMHQIQVACIVEHGRDTPHFDDFLRDIATVGRLIASATSEVGTGGDVRSSVCAVETDGESFSIEKQAPVISYGEYVDDILVTARRTPDSAASDQVLVHVARPNLTLHPMSEWDTLGMRGTCSIGFQLRATGALDQILPVPYAEISGRTMLPVSHITWASLWLGIAEEALQRAHAFVRSAARKTPGSVPPGARHLTDAHATIERTRALVDAAVGEFVAAKDDPDLALSMALALHMNDLKLAVSVDALSVVQAALNICGIAGYRNDSEYSVARLLRDIYSAGLMVHNDRIIEHNASLLCAVKDA